MKRIGLGCGGSSRLGQGSGASRADSVRLVRSALDLGITFFDTAAAYGTESIVGEAIAGQRDRVTLSTKAHALDSPASLTRSLEGSLKALRTDHIDIFHLHGVRPEHYESYRDRHLPKLQRLREAGKVRALGISENFRTDTGHETLRRALADGGFDAVMTGFNLLNPSAAARVLAPAREKGVATLIMFAVRRALSDPAALQDVLSGLVDIDAEGLLALVREGGARSLVDAGYRYCHQRAPDSIILTGTGTGTGTGNPKHLAENVASLMAPALSPEAMARLDALFGQVDSVSGN
jgi:aryl-alcohol dehydrogenase-like predicted oxidoreductase